MQSQNSNKGDGIAAVSPPTKETNTATAAIIISSSDKINNGGSFDDIDIIQHTNKFDYDSDTDKSTKDDHSCSTSTTDDSTTETEHPIKNAKVSQGCLDGQNVVGKVQKARYRSDRPSRHRKSLFFSLNVSLFYMNVSVPSLFFSKQFKMVTAITSTPVMKQALVDHFRAILPFCTPESVDAFLDSLEMVHYQSERDHLVSQLTSENGLLRFNDQADDNLVIPSKVVKLEKAFWKRIKLRGSNWKRKLLAVGMSNKEKWNHSLTKLKKYMMDLDIVYFYPGHPRVGDTVLVSLREVVGAAVRLHQALDVFLHESEEALQN